MTTQLSRLRELALKATPGPWSAFLRSNNRKRHLVLAGDEDSGSWVAECTGNPNYDKANAAFIAACSPDVVLALVEECERLRASRDALVKDDHADHLYIENLLMQLRAREEQLSAMTAARDEACGLAERAIRFADRLPTADWWPERDRIAELRKVGQ